MKSMFQILEEQHDEGQRRARREREARRLREYLLETGASVTDTNYGSGVLNTINWMLGEDNDPPVEMQ